MVNVQKHIKLNSVKLTVVLPASSGVAISMQECIMVRTKLAHMYSVVSFVPLLRLYSCCPNLSISCTEHCADSISRIC